MRFMVDECVGPRVAEWLRDGGHDVYSVFDQARGTCDEWLVEKSYAEKRILITCDRDFGELIVRQNMPHHGVIFLRLADQRPASVAAVLSKLLSTYADRIVDRFVVVTETTVRITGPETRTD